MRQLNRRNIETMERDVYCTLEKAIKQLGCNVEQISSKENDNIKRYVSYDKSRKTIYIPSWADQMMTSKVSDDPDFICEVVPSSERQDHDDSIIALECHNCNTMFTAHVSDHNEYKKITQNHGIRCPECKSDFFIEEISIFKFKWFRYWRGLRQSIRDKIRI